MRDDEDRRRKDADPGGEDGPHPADAVGHEAHHPEHRVFEVVAAQLGPVEARHLFAVDHLHLAGRLLLGDDGRVADLLDRHVHGDLGIARQHPRALRLAGRHLDRLGQAADRVDGDDVRAHAHHRETGERHADVDDEDDDDHVVDGTRHVAPRVRRLLGHVGDGLDARVGDRADGETVEELLPGRRDAPVDLLEQDPGLEQQHEGDGHDEELGGQVEHGEDDVEPRRLLDADHVDDDQGGGDEDAADGVVGELLEDGHEDRQVVRHEEGGDGDRGRVDEHLAPADAEAHELVEGAPCEAGRAARLRHRRGGLGVAPRRAHEEQAGDDEDQRRRAHGGHGHDAEGVVDRRAHVAVGRAEERRDAQDLVEALALSVFASRHSGHVGGATSPSAPGACVRAHGPGARPSMRRDYSRLGAGRHGAGRHGAGPPASPPRCSPRRCGSRAARG